MRGVIDGCRTTQHRQLNTADSTPPTQRQDSSTPDNSTPGQVNTGEVTGKEIKDNENKCNDDEKNKKCGNQNEEIDRRQ